MPKISQQLAGHLTHRKSSPTVVALVLTLALAGCGVENSEPAKVELVALKKSAPVLVTVAPVEVRAVRRGVSVIGTLHGFEEIVVTPKVEGRVEAMNFDVGDRVAPGAILLNLDPIDYRLALQEANRALEHELSRLDLQSPPGDDFDIEELPSVRRARLLVENAKRQYERQEKLLARNAIAKESFEQTETDVKVAEATLQQAQLVARSTLAAVRHRQSVLAVAQQKLEETSVKAPALPGSSSPEQPREFVIADRMASVGEMVRAFPSTPVFKLIVDDVLKLHVLVPERYMAQVVTGLDVELRVEAYPGETFAGKVARINPTVDPENRSFDVEVQIPNIDHRLKHGGFAKAEVIVGKADAALTVLIEALTRFAGVTKVFRIRGDAAEEVQIEIGTQGSGWIEALGGLESGDIVVTSGQSRLANGMRVSVRDKDSRIAQQP